MRITCKIHVVCTPNNCTVGIAIKKIGWQLSLKIYVQKAKRQMISKEFDISFYITNFLKKDWYHLHIYIVYHYLMWFPFRYLLFSMIWIAVAVLLTTIVINLHHRQPSTHKMPPWVRRIFIQKLPRLLLMRVSS